MEPGCTFKLGDHRGSADRAPGAAGHDDLLRKRLLRRGASCTTIIPTPISAWNDILVQSSNIGVGKLAIATRGPEFLRIRAQVWFWRTHGRGAAGRDRRIGASSALVGAKFRSPVMPMGQEVAATPLQVTTAMCAIANGGNLMIPQIIHEIFDERKSHDRARIRPQEVRTRGFQGSLTDAHPQCTDPT
ncbi:MAG: penicillin-binding transpeptidase domain-containing protein [Nibricoccus sp.]